MSHRIVGNNCPWIWKCQQKTFNFSSLNWISIRRLLYSLSLYSLLSAPCLLILHSALSFSRNSDHEPGSQKPAPKLPFRSGVQEILTKFAGNQTTQCKKRQFTHQGFTQHVQRVHRITFLIQLKFIDKRPTSIINLFCCCCATMPISICVCVNCQIVWAVDEAGRV